MAWRGWRRGEPLTARVLSLIAFVLGIAGGVLLIRSALDLRPSLGDALLSLLPMALGLMAVAGAFQIYVRRYWEGATLCIGAGAADLLVSGFRLAALLAILAGILAIVAKK